MVLRILWRIDLFLVILSWKALLNIDITSSFWPSAIDIKFSFLFGWIDLDLEVLAASSFVSALEPLSVPIPLLSCGKHVQEPCESSTLGSSIDSFCRLEKKTMTIYFVRDPYFVPPMIINRSLLINQVLWIFRKVMCIKTVWSSSSTCVTEIWINLDVNIKFKD